MTRFLLGLFMALPMMGFAQSNFQKGYLITNKKDTLQGWIDYRERSHNPTSVTFSADGRTATKTYTLQDCAEFYINDITSYRRFLVDISTASNEFSELTEKVDKSFRTDTVFLQVLQEGPNVSLYSYTDPIKERFYIQDKTDSVPVELGRELSHQVSDPGKIVVNIQYARQLLGLLRKYGKSTEAYEKKLSLLDYNSRDLIKMTLLINDQQLVPSKFPKIRWFAGLSVDLGSTTISGLHPLSSSDAKSKTTASPMISAGVDVFANPAVRKLVFRTELSLNKSNSEISGAGGFSAFDVITGTLSSGILHHIHNADNFKVYLSGSIALNFSKFSNQTGYKVLDGGFGTYKVDYTFDLKPMTVTFPVNLGVVLHKKFELLAGYNFPTSLIEKSYIGMHRHRIRVGINYLFGK